MRANEVARERELVVGCDELADAKVHDFDGRATIASIDDDVCGLDVPVHDAVIVGFLKARANLRGDVERLHLLQTAAPAKNGGEAFSGRKLHRNVDIALSIYVTIVKAYRVWVPEPLKQRGLTEEPCSTVFAAGVAGPQQLERDQAIAVDTASCKHAAHPTVAQHADDLVLTTDSTTPAGPCRQPSTTTRKFIPFSVTPVAVRNGLANCGTRTPAVL